MASTTLNTLEWSNSELIEGDVPAAIARLKEEHGPELQVHGSWQLLQTLLAHELVDEFRLKIYPVVVGPGKRLFGDGTHAAGLETVDHKLSPSGVMLATYRPAGELITGSFARDEPTEAEVERR